MDEKDAEIARLKAELDAKQPTKKKGGCLKWLAIGGAVIAGAFVLRGISGQAPAPASNSPSNGNTIAAAPPASLKPVDDSPWNYRQVDDEINGSKIIVACTSSKDTVHLDFPYSETGAEICIRRQGKELDAYYALHKNGQILCGLSDGCSVKMRFDSKPAETFSAVEASDHSSRILFFSNATRFLKSVQASQQVIIEVEFFQNGSQSLHFPTKGLKWPPPGSDKPS